MVDLSQAPVMGRFSGNNPLDWVIQTEKYFIFYGILSKHKLSWASFYLDGEALEWYRWLFRNKQLAGWDHFVDKLFIRFQSRKTHGNRLACLRQFTTVNDSQTRAATISSWSTIANSPSSQSWNAWSDYSKVNSAHQVFGEKLNKTTDIVVDVKNAMLVKSGSAEMLANQAKEEIFHSILDETKEEADFPVPQHFNEPLIYDNNQAHKVFDEFSVASKDVILESHKMLTINTDTIKESNYVTGVRNEDKNEEEELFAIGNKIRQLVPAFVGIPPLWFDSPFSSFSDFARFSMLHKLGIARCSEELCGMLSTCRYDQLTNRGITDHFSRLGRVSLVLTLHLFPPDQSGLAFPFDPGSCLFTMFLRVTRNSVFCLTSDSLDHNKFIMSTLWYSFNWVGKGQDQCLPGFLLSKLRELSKAEKIQQEVFLFANMVQISALVASWVVCSPFEYAIDVICAIQIKGAKAYTIVVFGKSLFALEHFGNEHSIFIVVAGVVVVARSIQDHILFFANIAQFLFATTCGVHATNIVLDPNLEDKVLIEDGSIVMNQPRPNVNTYTDATQLVIGPKRSNKIRRPSQRLVWDPGLINN